MTATNHLVLFDVWAHASRLQRANVDCFICHVVHAFRVKMKRAILERAAIMAFHLTLRRQKERVVVAQVERVESSRLDLLIAMNVCHACACEVDGHLYRQRINVALADASLHLLWEPLEWRVVVEALALRICALPRRVDDALFCGAVVPS